MKNIARVLSAAFAVALPGCNISIEPDDPVKLRFEGVVTAGDRPLEGAKVTIESTFFVWTLPVATRPPMRAAGTHLPASRGA